MASLINRVAGRLGLLRDLGFADIGAARLRQQRNGRRMLLHARR